MKTTVFFILSILLVLGCASYRTTGYEPFAEWPQRIGVVADSVVSFPPFEVLQFPDGYRNTLQIRLTKQLDQLVRYDSTSYIREIRKCKPTIPQHWIWIIGDNFENAPILAPIAIVGYPAFVLLDYLAGNNPPERTKYREVPNSFDTTKTYRHEKVIVPAAGETLVANGYDSIVTRSDGVANFHFSLSKYSDGVTISHVKSGDSYVVKRVARTRTVKADWVKELSMLSDVAGTGLLIKDIRSLALAGAAPEAYISAVVISVATGLTIGWIIEEMGTSKEFYFDWLIYRTN